MPRLKDPQSLGPRWRAVLDDCVAAIAWSGDGRLVAAASAAGAVAILDGGSGQALLRLAGHPQGALCLAWAPQDRLLATGGADGTARLWHPTSGHEVAALEGGAAWVEYLAWGDAPYLLATAAGKHLKLWSADGRLLRTAEPPHASTISGLVWHPQRGRFASCCYGSVRLHAPLKAAPADVFEYAGSLIALDWSPDGRWIACGCQDATVHLWEVASGTDLQMSGYAGKVRALAWDPTGRYLATGGGADVTVWDFSGKGPAGSKPRILSAHLKPVSHMAYQPQGGLLAMGGPDGIVSLWNPLKPARPMGLARPDTQVSALSWRPDGQHFVSGHTNGDVVAWSVPSEGRGFGL
ncbi:MAG: WD40 repeat domain-containing protein [Aphanocapsa lilacina HA4352-LM1]|jgi:WD40 repeat protein|nr:WD40 repeat domain-containing protein [Aphanocapsa lilacina HA4352-LM1]